MNSDRFQRLKTVLNLRQPDLTVLLEDIHKPHNIAAITRTADAVALYGIHGVGDKSVMRRRPKASSGARRWVKVKMHDTTGEAYEAFRAERLRIVVAHPGSGSLPFTEYDFTQPTAIVLGSELVGLSDYAVRESDAMIHVPMLGFTESLNVSVTAALILYEAKRQREAAGRYDQCRLSEALYKKTLFEWAWPQIAHYCRGEKIPYPDFDMETGDILEQIPGSASLPKS